MDTIGYVVHCNNLFPLPSLIEYKTMLQGKPQNLVSKFKVSYSLILNLIRGGNTDFKQFVNKTMIYEELQTALIYQRKCVLELQEKIVLKEKNIEHLKTPRYICLIYLEDIPRDVSQKKRKELERNRVNMVDTFFTIEKDAVMVNEWKQMIRDIETEQNHLHYLETFFDTQIQNICMILMDEKFIIKNEDEYSLTDTGRIGASILEIHPLVFSTILHEYDFFKDFSVIELIGLLSIFCDIKIPEDQRNSINSITDTKLRSCVQQIQNTYTIYQTKEIDMEMNTGINYDDVIQFDLIEYVIEWCKLETEDECKYFVQNTIRDKEISLGDFSKSILKISAIGKELSNLCEKIGNIEFLYKLSKIDDYILKYIIMSQSLYV
jgi:superfamily II RNA helicase